MNTINILETDGSNKNTITLPEVFKTPYRPEVIQKVYLILILFKDKADILQLDRW